MGLDLRGAARAAPCGPWEFWGTLANLALIALVLAWKTLEGHRKRRSAALGLTKAAGPRAAARKEEQQEEQTEGTAGGAGDGQPGMVDGAMKGDRFVPEEDNVEEAKTIMAMGKAAAALTGLQLPYSSFRTFGERLNSNLLRLVCAPAIPAVVCIVTVALLMSFFQKFPPALVSAIIGCATITILGIILIFCQLVGHDKEWREIDDFLKHRHIRPTVKNALALISIVATCFQLGALATKLFRKPTPENAESSYEKAKLLIARCFGTFLFDISFVKTLLKEGPPWIRAYGPYLQFSISVLCVLVWWLLYAGIFHNIVIRARKLSFEDTKKRMALYDEVKERTTYTTVFLFLSDTLMVPIVEGLLRVVDCWHDKDGGLVLEMNHDTRCFIGIHAWISMCAVACFVFYAVTAMVTAPFIIADSSGRFSSDALDLRYEPLFYVQERLCKCALSISTVYFNHYPGVPRNLGFALAVYLAWTSCTTQPCSIMWINILRGAVYQASALISLAVMFDAISLVPWLPLLMVPLGVSVIAGRFVWDVCFLKTPGFRASPCVGTEYEDSVPFSDVSLLRGMRHRLALVAIWQSADGVHGCACVYHVDGTVIGGPAHYTSWTAFREPSDTIVLDEDEFLVALHADSAGTDSRYCLAIGTSKGRRLLFGNTSGIPEDMSTWAVQVAPGEAVGLYGARNGHIHTLGFIVQDSSEEEERAPVLGDGGAEEGQRVAQPLLEDRSAENASPEGEGERELLLADGSQDEQVQQPGQ